jgi:hypothetical protein
VIFYLLSLIPIVLVKSSVAAFLLRQEILKSPSLVPRGTGLGGELWNQLLVNCFAYAGCHNYSISYAYIVYLYHI